MDRFGFFYKGLKVLVLLMLAGAFALGAPEYAHYLPLIIALLLMVSGGGVLLNYVEKGRWSEHKAILKQVTEQDVLVTESEYGPTKYFYPDILYQYEINGKPYEGNTVSLERENIWVPEHNYWGDPVRNKDKWWSSFAVDDEVPVYVNPENPMDSVLIRRISEKRNSHGLALLIGGLLMGLCWLGLLYMTNLLM